MHRTSQWWFVSWHYQSQQRRNACLRTESQRFSNVVGTHVWGRIEFWSEHSIITDYISRGSSMSQSQWNQQQSQDTSLGHKNHKKNEFHWRDTSLTYSNHKRYASHLVITRETRLTYSNHTRNASHLQQSQKECVSPTVITKGKRLTYSDHKRNAYHLQRSQKERVSPTAITKARINLLYNNHTTRYITYNILSQHRKLINYITHGRNFSLYAIFRLLG